MKIEVLIVLVILVILIIIVISRHEDIRGPRRSLGCGNFVPLRTDELSPLPVAQMCGSVTFTAAQSAFSLFGTSSNCSSLDPWIYVNTDGQLGRININTQVRQVIGNIGVVLYDIAFGNNGVLYGINPNGTNLYSLSLTTGAATLLGSLSTNLGSTSLTCGPDGFLYGVYGTALRRANPTTRVVTTVRNDMTNTIGDCAFIGKDFYWSTSSSNVIKKITGNVATGPITTIGPCSSTLYALASVNCTLWGIDAYTVYQIDTTTAATSGSFTVSSFGGTYIHGAASRSDALSNGGAYLVDVASLQSSCLPITISTQQTTIFTFSDPSFTTQIVLLAGGSFTITSTYTVSGLVNGWIASP